MINITRAVWIIRVTKSIRIIRVIRTIRIIRIIRLRDYNHIPGPFDLSAAQL